MFKYYGESMGKLKTIQNECKVVESKILAEILRDCSVVKANIWRGHSVHANAGALLK